MFIPRMLVLLAAAACGGFGDWFGGVSALAREGREAVRGRPDGVGAGMAVEGV